MKELRKEIELYNATTEKEKLDKEVILNYVDSHKDCLTREDKIAHFTTSAWIINKDKTKVLMIYHNI